LWSLTSAGNVQPLFLHRMASDVPPLAPELKPVAFAPDGKSLLLWTSERVLDLDRATGRVNAAIGVVSWAGTIELDPARHRAFTVSTETIHDRLVEAPAAPSVDRDVTSTVPPSVLASAEINRLVDGDVVVSPTGRLSFLDPSGNALVV